MKKKYSKALLAKARWIRAAVFDCDGVFTNNTEITGFDHSFPPMVLKCRSHSDGQGVSLIRAVGIPVAIITGEKGPGAQMIAKLVERWNSLPSVQSGAWTQVTLFTGCAGMEKVAELERWLATVGVSMEQCAVMGDDLVDVPMLRVAGFRACPITAEEVVREMADFVSERPAGYGAVRDLANLILTARGIDPTTLPTK